MYGIPLSEEDRLNFGVQAERLSIVFQGVNDSTTPGFGYRLNQFATNTAPAGLTSSDPNLINQYREFYGSGKEFNDVSLKTSYVHDSRDEFYFPNKGITIRVACQFLRQLVI